MRRPGRYTLAVMAWVAVYAGWSSVLGLLIAAVTGERLDNGDRVAPTVGLGVSTLFTVVLPLVPTVVALWFNDWLRDGAPSRADRQRSARQAAGASQVAEPAVSNNGAAVTGDRDELSVPAVVQAESAADSRERGDPPEVVAPRPLGVPEVASAAATTTGFPVAPLLRAGDEAVRTASPTTSPRAGAQPSDDQAGSGAAAQRTAEPVIDPDDPLGVGHLRLPGVGGRDEPLGV